ncbi:MAG TPA: hypothetical protein VM537_06570 [Anaerolineae bacterium]|nr:hypothetical protein [Anaerolineae bacterium]
MDATDDTEEAEQHIPRYISGYGPRKRCTVCNILFQRAPPPSLPAGYNRCRSCEAGVRRKTNRSLRPTQCDRCGDETYASVSRVHNRESQILHGRRVKLILCESCSAAYHNNRKRAASGVYVKLDERFATPRIQE